MEILSPLGRPLSGHKARHAGTALRPTPTGGSPRRRKGDDQVDGSPHVDRQHRLPGGLNSTPSGRAPFPRQFAEAIGHVVLEAAQCEDTLGELVVLHRNASADADFDWWTSGERLADAVEGLGDPDAGSIAADYRDLLRQRHMIVHGLWLQGSEGHVNMMRAKSTKASPRAPRYDVDFGSETDLAALADQFNHLSDALLTPSRASWVLPSRSTTPLALDAAHRP